MDFVGSLCEKIDWLIIGCRRLMFVVLNRFGAENKEFENT